jgi:hypothetical protein
VLCEEREVARNKVKEIDNQKDLPDVSAVAAVSALSAMALALRRGIIVDGQM